MVRFANYIKILVFFLGLGPGVLLAAASDPGGEQRQLLQEANDYFHQANDAKDPALARPLYQKSLLRFERLLQEGVRNGKLYYNIGNVYFRLDDLGRAVLNYRRAEQYRPGDENLRQNLAFALSRQPDKLEGKEEARILQTLFFWHYDLGLGTRLALFAVGYGGSWLCACLWLFWRRPFTQSGLALSLFLLVAFGGSLLAERLGGEGRRGVLVAAEVVGRKGDGQSYQPSFEQPLHAGLDFLLREDRGQWRQIELRDGRRCWVEAESTELL